MKFPLQLLILIVMATCQSKKNSHNDTIEVFERFDELQSIIDSDKNKLWVINFWATSCGPCIKEMPHFNELEKAYRENDLKIVLVSLDPIKYLETRVYSFVKKYQIIPEVVLLEDQDYSTWTEKIDSTWFGALPATLIIKGEQRKFRFGAYPSYEELLDDVKEMEESGPNDV